MARHADEPSIMRYVKIAASLRDKTVRDVALRCRWMTVSSCSLNNVFNLPNIILLKMLLISDIFIQDKKDKNDRI